MNKNGKCKNKQKYSSKSYMNIKLINKKDKKHEFLFTTKNNFNFNFYIKGLQF